jgi:hypothetical protein
MPPAPRPISSRTPHSSRPSHHHQSTTTDHPPSSLDLLFSYSRSAGFYGENLPHAPSFVQAYRRPGHDRDATDESEAITTEEGEGGTTTDDLTEGEVEGEEGVEWSDDDGNFLHPPWADDAQLPRNAVVTRPAAPATRRESVQTAWTGETPSSTATETGETTPLLAPIDPPSGSAAARGRRPSTFTKEVWKARIEEHRGESSWGQTLFNTFALFLFSPLLFFPHLFIHFLLHMLTFGAYRINVLIGVGLLADPLAMADSGWALGIAILIFCSFTTFCSSYSFSSPCPTSSHLIPPLITHTLRATDTAVLLSRLMRLHPSSHTYADVLIRAYGPWTRSLIYFLFVLELSTFSVAAVELFADSISSLYPKVGVVVFKLIAFGMCASLLPSLLPPAV